MQKVIFEAASDVRANSVRELMEKHRYVGFHSRDLGFRYMISPWGAGAIAIRPEGHWSNPALGAGQFYVFESSEKLLRWMIGE